MTGAVVVGVSPTTGSPAALQWAAREAALRGAPLRAVMAWRNTLPPASGTRPPAPGARTGAERAVEAETMLREFVDQALGAPGSDVECSVVKGGAVNALLTEARDAQLLVVGEPRQGRAAGVRASFVGPQLVLRSHCPVVVMPAARVV